MIEKKRVLITGATGFVGQHLWRALEEEGSPEFAVFGTAYPQSPSPSARGLFYLDLRSEKDVMRVVAEVRPEWVFHLAAQSNVRNSWHMRNETIETNIIGTQNLLEAVRQAAPGARVLFLSSAGVYGVTTSATEVLSEESPIRIGSPYAYSKAAGEMLCEFYGRVENSDIVIARPFPHTGPGQTADFVCSDWARQIVKVEGGESAPLIKVGNIEIRRDFCDVRDVVRAYILLMQEGRKGEVYNVCSGKAILLHEILYCLIREAFGKIPISVEVDPVKLRKNDIPWLIGSNRKIEEETGWSPRIPIKQTLRDLLLYWRRV